MVLSNLRAGHCCDDNVKHGISPGVCIFQKNLRATWKFKVPGEWHVSSSILKTNK